MDDHGGVQNNRVKRSITLSIGWENKKNREHAADVILTLLA